MLSEKSRQRLPILSTPDLEFEASDYAVPELPSELPHPDKTEYEGKLKKVEYEQRQNIIVDKAEQERIAFELGRLLRENLTGLPARLAAKVSVECDAKKVKRILRSECDRCARTILGRMADL